MVTVVGVRFQKAGRVYYYAPGEHPVDLQEPVVVESQQCKQLGYIAMLPKEVADDEVVGDLKPILYRATSEDLQKAAANEEEAQRALKIAKEKIQERELEMKLTQVEYSFDKSKLIFCFTADGRVDFRELVKDLAGIFKTRIELRQVGVRDEAKILGGIGPCGRPLCCTTFLGDFVPVSIKMAKDQSLSLNPTKISGLCGRLMCCLQYENEQYEEAKKAMPDYGTEVVTPEGKGKVIGLNLLNRIVKVKVFGRETPFEYAYEELQIAEKG
ncbi:PSP1 domain-containing protein [Enterococcus nangangensis]|uniref:PSP1 domain-containing protein n=1 Tax=Enterococcus nangangensis TaxID=2559926 RepID=UPI0010F6F263|nr:stage 0 sporulation family protein [Enterococcus nangangensis]